MPRFRYKAVAPAGDTVEGEIEARNRNGVIDQLHDRGLVPIRADEVKGSSAAEWLGRDLWAGRGVGRRDLALLTRELATMLEAGLPLDRSLEIAIELAERDAVRRVVGRVLDAVRGGATLADAMAAEHEAFPGYYASMVRAGEAGGTLGEVLGRLADYIERAQAVAEKVRSALIYPAIVLAMAGATVVILLAVVVPEFTPLFEDAGAALPVSTQVLVAVGDGFRRFWWLFLVVVLAAVLLIRRQLEQPAARRRWHRLVLGLPLAGDLVAKIEMARLARTVGTLLMNGVTLLNALAIARSTLNNAVIAETVDEVSESLKQGKGLAEPMIRSGRFPPLALQLIRVGEETGKLEEMLLRVADTYDEESERAIQRLLAVLVPALTLLLGVLIAAIIGAVLTALLSVYDLPL